MKYHYKVVSAGGAIILDSSLMQDFEGYETSDQAKRVAYNRAEENRLDKFTVTITPVEKSQSFTL